MNPSVKQSVRRLLSGVAIFSGLVLTAHAQVVITDTLNGVSSSYPWKAFGGACLTAGNGANSTIPACIGNPAYDGKVQVGGVSGRLPDPPGQGALRLTNGDYQFGGQNGSDDRGAVVSTQNFPTNQGVRVTFATVSYGGNGSATQDPTGADGISFYLLDARYGPNIGAPGGALGYACNSIFAVPGGVAGGYLGVGLDEYGNYSNPKYIGSDGPGLTPQAISVRGAGSITYPSLNLLNPTYYPSNLSPTDQITAVQNTCSKGTLQNWSGRRITDRNRWTVENQMATSEPVLDYKMLVAPQPVVGNIANQYSVMYPLRGAANRITYDLRITPDNLLSLAYSYNGGVSIPVMSNQSITAGNGPLPANFLFGFAASTGYASNVHEIACFKATPFGTSSSSAASNVQQSAKVEAGSQAYFAYSHEINNWGQLTASSLLIDAAGNLSISSRSNWDASCVLTGGSCLTTGASNVAQGSAVRQIITSVSGSGVAFQYGALPGNIQNALGGNPNGAARVAYLRGDRNNEIQSSGAGLFRRRDGVLGDIVGASPVWVGYPTLPYNGDGRDLRTKSTMVEFGASYAAFAASRKTRPNVVYAGANDGMLHGFRAGAYNSAGGFNTAVTPNDGREVVAYMPAGVLNTIYSTNPNLDFSSRVYAHNSFVDATPGTGDLYYAGTWHTWLVGGLGGGGNPAGVVSDSATTLSGSIYALDITDPATFSELSPTKLVKGDWNSSTLTCAGSSTCGRNLGAVYGTPLIRRLHDGNWAAIFGNGRNSETGTAGVFIMTVNAGNGSTTFRFLDTGRANPSDKNGIDFVTSADLDGDHVTDYLYAGDSKGNLWRFDLTSSVPEQWRADPSPMFTTPSGQPISSRVAVTAIPETETTSRLIVAFGTGRKTPQTMTGPAAYQAGSQAIYGIWDGNLAAWNAQSITKYVLLKNVRSPQVADLQPQAVTGTVTGSSNAYRKVTQNPVCWQDSTACQSNNNRYGWYLTLPGSGEQVIYGPTVAYDTLYVNTTIPGSNGVLTCNQTPVTGFTMGLSLTNGGTTPKSPFATASKNEGIADTVMIGGVGLNAAGSPGVVTVAGTPYLVQQTSTVTGTTAGVVTRVDQQGTGKGTRITWKKLR